MRKGASTANSVPGSGELSIGKMFDRIAPTYDSLNHLLSLGCDFSWRRRVIRVLPQRAGIRVADLATGTGDLLIALLRRRPDVSEAVGLDLSEEMLRVGRRKVERRGLADRVRLVHDDATHSSLPAGSFDAVTMAFGIRNTPDARATLCEIHRLLLPGGAAVILEFSVPRRVAFQRAYLLYLRRVVPALGALISGDGEAYRYLNTSIEGFHRPDEFCALMRECGFAEVTATPLTWGIASIYRGLKGH